MRRRKRAGAVYDHSKTLGFPSLYPVVPQLTLLLHHLRPHGLKANPPPCPSPNSSPSPAPPANLRPREGGGLTVRPLEVGGGGGECGGWGRIQVFPTFTIQYSNRAHLVIIHHSVCLCACVSTWVRVYRASLQATLYLDECVQLCSWRLRVDISFSV